MRAAGNSSLKDSDRSKHVARKRRNKRDPEQRNVNKEGLDKKEKPIVRSCECFGLLRQPEPKAVGGGGCGFLQGPGNQLDLVLILPLFG